MPSLKGLPTKAKEAPSPHEVRLSPLDTNPVFHSLRDSQSSQQKNMDQTNTHNTNQQSTEQQRSYPQKNQEENDQATILVPYTQERDDTTIENQIFYSKVPIKLTGHSKGYPKNN